MFSDVKLRFIVTSDIHYKVDTDVEKERFEKGMNMAYAYASGCAYKNIDAFLYQMQKIEDSVRADLRSKNNVCL